MPLTWTATDWPSCFSANTALTRKASSSMALDEARSQKFLREQVCRCVSRASHAPELRNTERRAQRANQVRFAVKHAQPQRVLPSFQVQRSLAGRKALHDLLVVTLRQGICNGASFNADGIALFRISPYYAIQFSMLQAVAALLEGQRVRVNVEDNCHLILRLRRRRKHGSLE